MHDYLCYLSDKGDINIHKICTNLELNYDAIVSNQALATNLTTIFKSLPNKYRDSGLTRYIYSALKVKSSLDTLKPKAFLKQFNLRPITIDFKKTRDSTDKEGDKKRNRLYSENDIDLVAACLFTRTMKWEFLYAKAASFDRHKEHNDKYSDKLILKPDDWTDDLSSLIA